MMSRAGASARRIFEVVDTENTIQDPENPIEPHHLRGAVRFEQVSFRYAGSDVFALTDVDFAIEPGMTVAIVGPTGSGKSSIVNLIPRFYDPVAGRVLIDGYDVRSLKLSGLRRQVGVVMQDTLLFSGSIAENIAYGDPDASQDEIEVAAKLAHAHQFIIEQPEGYATRIGEGGVGLSGGQMQRIAIARALLLSPAILIMDDSTSAVDAETEYQIQQSLKQLAMGRTTFIIAQRISTVRRADLILVIDRSRLVGSGTHDQLLATSQLYGEIVDSQLIRDEVPSTDNEAGAGEPGGAKP